MSLESSNTSQTYAILRSCTVESDNKPHKVTISVIDLAATFLYTTIPKLAQSVRAPDIKFKEKDDGCANFCYCRLI
jgi:hypothetical protein